MTAVLGILHEAEPSTSKNSIQFFRTGARIAAAVTNRK